VCINSRNSISADAVVAGERASYEDFSVILDCQRLHVAISISAGEDYPCSRVKYGINAAIQVYSDNSLSAHVVITSKEPAQQNLPIALDSQRLADSRLRRP